MSTQIHRTTSAEEIIKLIQYFDGITLSDLNALTGANNAHRVRSIVSSGIVRSKAFNGLGGGRAAHVYSIGSKVNFDSIQTAKKFGKTMCYLRTLGLRDDQINATESDLTTCLAFSDNLSLHVALVNGLEDKSTTPATPIYVVDSREDINRLFAELPKSLLDKGIILVEVSSVNVNGYVMNSAGLVPLDNLSPELLNKAWHLLNLREDKLRNSIILARFAKSARLAGQLTRNFRSKSRDTNE